MSNFWSGLKINSFPSDERLVRGKWSPLYFEPIPGSGERLTIAVVVIGQNNFEIVSANRVSALNCLFPDDFARLDFFIRTALEAIRLDVNERGIEALTNPRSPMSGVHFGVPREALGESLKSIGVSWLKRSSSLVNQNDEIEEQSSQMNQEAKAPITRRFSDRLPLVVYSGVSIKNPLLAANFHEDIRAGRPNRRRYPARIDYLSPKIVVNFCTLKAARVSMVQVDKTIKPPLWDLRAYRDKHPEQGQAKFELHVQRPARYDTQFTESEHRRVAEAIANLEFEAKIAAITLRTYSSPDEIVERVVEAESA